MFLELGPGENLLAFARRCLTDETGLWLPSLRDGQDEWRQFLETLGASHTGCPGRLACVRPGLPTPKAAAADVPVSGRTALV